MKKKKVETFNEYLNNLNERTLTHYDIEKISKSKPLKDLLESFGVNQLSKDEKYHLYAYLYHGIRNELANPSSRLRKKLEREGESNASSVISYVGMFESLFEDLMLKNKPPKENRRSS